LFLTPSLQFYVMVTFLSELKILAC